MIWLVFKVRRSFAWLTEEELTHQLDVEQKDF